MPGNARSNSLSVDPAPSEKHEVEEVTCGEQADGWPQENLEDGRSVKPEVSIEEDEDRRARDKALVKASAIEGGICNSAATAARKGLKEISGKSKVWHPLIMNSD